MKTKRYTHQEGCLLFILLILGLILAGCTSLTPRTTRLRITNDGTVTVNKLTVLFPEEGIEFGDIPAGTTTAYQEVPNGVYSYAAYRFEIDEQIILQPVIDWVGEEPLEGNAFTYTVDFNPNRRQGEMVRLVEVTIDE